MSGEGGPLADRSAGYGEVESYVTGEPQRGLEFVPARGVGGNPPAAATIEAMQAWAAGLMASRAPDFVIGDDYLRRWYVVPRNAWSNLYLHEIRRSDDDRALHDHPWANSSLVLAGGYVEHTPEGVFERRAGDFVTRPAEALHRLEIAPGGRAVSLFATGPTVREWGFACPQGWRHWKEFLALDNAAQVGRGCGE